MRPKDKMLKIMKIQAKEMNVKWKTEDELVQKMLIAYMPAPIGNQQARIRLQELIDIERDREFSARPNRLSQAIRLANSSN